jgi:hypothetical protein
MNARWWSQRFPPEGSAASEGIRRQLGTPRLDPLTVLVREAAQNSADARISDAPVEFTVSMTRLRPESRDRWQSLLLPEPSDGAFGLTACLADESTVMLVVSDRNTTGLGGPLRADQVGDDPDFVNLVRNIGEPRDKEYGGGTYGFGKGILFTTSTVGVILVRSRCMWRGRPQTRLIGVALGHSFRADGIPYTGRHWWGRLADDNVLDPLLDDEAELVARQLGLPDYDAPDALGTDIAIVGAGLGRDLDEPGDGATTRGIEDAADYIASAVLWNLWPLLTASDDGKPAMTCKVVTDERTIDIPDPVTVPRLRPFVIALRAVDGGGGKSIVRRKPAPLDVGTFHAVPALASQRRDWRDRAAPFNGPAHHCALMRQAGLVVAYIDGPPIPDDDQQYGAVFRSSRAADEAFAAAEPPTHDAWITHGLSDGDNSTVQAALRSIRTRLADLADTTRDHGTLTTQPPLGQLSQRFADLVSPTADTSAKEEPPARGRNGVKAASSRRPMTTVVTPAALTMIDGEPLIHTTVVVSDSVQPLWLTAAALVALDVGTEAEPPAGTARPEIIEMRSDAARVPGDRVRLDSSASRRWTIIARPVPNAATRIVVRLDPEPMQEPTT